MLRIKKLFWNPETDQHYAWLDQDSSETEDNLTEVVQDAEGNWIQETNPNQRIDYDFLVEVANTGSPKARRCET